MINKLREIKAILFKNKNGQPGHFNCPVCKSANVKMNPLPSYYLGKYQEHQTIHNPFFLETINFENYNCSKCYASDRDRLYALYLDTFFNEFKGKVKLLDIAPASALRSFIGKYQNVEYRSMDLMMSDVDDNFDITSMGYKDETFDFLICSHVLEHIPDDIKAMKELYRVLKKGGKGIVMVPIFLQLEEISEDPNCNDIGMRWKNFGQDDHIRVYSKGGFINRLETVGFKVDQLGIDYFGASVFAKNAIFSKSVLYIVNK